MVCFWKVWVNIILFLSVILCAWFTVSTSSGVGRFVQMVGGHGVIQRKCYRFLFFLQSFQRLVLCISKIK
jgi:hypothetical protein